MCCKLIDFLKIRKYLFYIKFFAHIDGIITIMRIPNKSDQIEGHPVFGKPLDFEGKARVFGIPLHIHQGRKLRHIFDMSDIGYNFGISHKLLIIN